MATQSIIVYRNPLEQQFWESGALVPVFSGCAIGFVSFLLTYNVLSWTYRKLSKKQYYRNSNQYVTYAAGFVATAAGLSTMLFML